jgi:single-strand DNA-binding protein
MSDLNSFTGIGRLTRDPELATSQAGKYFSKFSIACNTGFGDNKKTSFFNCVVFGKQAETLAQYFKKGQRIGIKGELKQSTWNDKDGNKRSDVGITVQSIYFIEKKDSNINDILPVDDVPMDAVPPANPFSDDDIPF